MKKHYPTIAERIASAESTADIMLTDLVKQFGRTPALLDSWRVRKLVFELALIRDQKKRNAWQIEMRGHIARGGHYNVEIKIEPALVLAAIAATDPETAGTLAAHLVDNRRTNLKLWAARHKGSVAIDDVDDPLGWFVRTRQDAAERWLAEDAENINAKIWRAINADPDRFESMVEKELARIKAEAK
jgi:hypothetical protein